MKTAVLQFDNRPIEQLGLMPFLIERNRAYAAAHGYDYRFIREMTADLPVYWQKPHLIGELLTHGGYDTVLWVDTDAVVHDLARQIESLFIGGEAMVGAGDNPYWASPFNAGVMAVRGAEGAALMQRWMELFAGTAWTRTETAWVCDEEWAGPSFEQGAFNAHLLEAERVAGTVRLADWKLLQAPFPVSGAFTLHFAGLFKANIGAYLHEVA